VPSCGKILPALSLVEKNRMGETPMGTQAADPALSSVATPTNSLSSLPARPEQDDDADRLRGVAALPHPRDILFTDEVELDAGTLPRWRPHIIVDDRRLADNDHE
jgi:hypothetical protein